MLTGSEVAVITAGIGVAGTAFGGWIAARAGRVAASNAARDQRALEADRRRDDRSADLYRELLVEMARSERHQYEILNGMRDDEPSPHDSGEAIDDKGADEFWSWRARVTIFASDEVRALWEEWHAILREGWSPEDPRDQRGRLRAAQKRVEGQMRSELSWSAEAQSKEAAFSGARRSRWH